MPFALHSLTPDVGKPTHLRAARAGFSRIPRHVGFIPDGNRRWAEARGAPKRDGYPVGVGPGLALVDLCRKIGIEEISVYGFTKENVRRPADQVRAFRAACVEFARRAVERGAALHVIGDDGSALFPDELRPYAKKRGDGDILLNLLVNYGWQWDLSAGAKVNGNASRPASVSNALASRLASRVDLVVRWGGRRRLSGFLPVQCAYADIYVVDTLWPDMQDDDFIDALHWYAEQDVTLGG